MPRIVIPDDAPPVMRTSAAYRRLTEQTAVEYYDTLPGSEDNLVQRIAGAEIVINIRASTKFTGSVFRRCPKLQLLSVWGTGIDHVDLAAAQRRGVTVTNTPGVSAPAIAEHALALMLAVARRIPSLDSETRQGKWPRGQITLLRDKTLGIVGLGAIGREFARLGEGIGMRVVAWSRRDGHSALEKLLRESDVISLHLRLSPQSRGLIGKREFEWMKPAAILINTARGAIVDESALVEALSSGRIAGAGLDVFDIEPLPLDHPLTKLNNVVLTPHCAGITAETLEAGLRLAIENVWNFMAGRPTNRVEI